jgi:GT2 family glycosyltransferase
MNKISVVILNWNGIKYLKLFLGTIVEYSSIPGTEVCVADNGSGDNSVDWIQNEFPDVRIIRLDHNYGFAGGYNEALARVDSEYYVLINSDVEVTEGWLQPMLEFMEKNPGTAACQPKILDFGRREYFEYAGAAGGYIDKFGYPFCRGRILDATEKDEGQYDDPAGIFWSSGACMMMRADAWKKSGGFDDGFFAHMEEIDLCWRLLRMGYRIQYIPGSVVYHVGGGSLSYGSPFKAYLNFRNSLFMLYKNLPSGDLHSVMFRRKVLNGLAAVIFLLRGRFSLFMAVFRAHMSYYGSLPALREKRRKLENNRAGVNTALILNKSIIFEFYMRGRKTFRSLITGNNNLK